MRRFSGINIGVDMAVGPGESTMTSEILNHQWLWGSVFVWESDRIGDKSKARVLVWHGWVVSFGQGEMWSVGMGTGLELMWVSLLLVVDW